MHKENDLILEGIRKIYGGTGGVIAVDGVSLAVEHGQFLTLLGPSGCGKTTLLRIVGGFVPPSAGRVFVRGRDVTELPPQRRPTAMVFQDYALFPHMTAAENVAFGLKVRRRPAAEIAARVRKTLEIVGLSHLGDRFPHQLSGGQQQRVALARSLGIEPPVLLMDEPLGALDAKLREEMQYELCAIQRRLNITTVYVTHDQEEAFSMSDKVAVMNHGRILQLGPPDDIYRHPNSSFVATFVGRSNVLRGVVGNGAQTIMVANGLTFAAGVPAGLGPGAAAIMIVRPGDIRMGAAEGADNRARGKVELRRFTGGAYLYFVRLSPEVIVIAEDRRSVPIAVGEDVELSWRSGDSIVLAGGSGPDS